MFTFGIVMCFISAAIYGMVVYIQIKRIDRLESEQIISRDRINLYRERYQTINVFCHHLDERIHRIERHQSGIVETRTPMDADAYFGKTLSVYPNTEPSDINIFTADVFAPPVEHAAEVA